MVIKDGLKKISYHILTDTHEDNIASQKVLKKNNFYLQGKIKKFFNNKKVSKNKLIFAKFKR